MYTFETSLNAGRVTAIAMHLRDQMGLSSYPVNSHPFNAIPNVIAAFSTGGWDSRYWFTVAYIDTSTASIVTVAPWPGAGLSSAAINFVDRLRAAVEVKITPPTPTTVEAPPITPQRKQPGRKTTQVYADAYQRIYEQGEDRADVIRELLTAWVGAEREQGRDPDASGIDAEQKRIASGIDYQIKRRRKSNRQ